MDTVEESRRQSWRGVARKANILLCALGLAVFGFLWSQLYFNPDALMDKAQDYAVAKAEEAMEDAFVSVEERYADTALGRRVLEFARERSPDAEGRLGALRDTLGSPEMEEAKRRATEYILLIADRLKAEDITVEVDGEPPNEGTIMRFLGALQTTAGLQLDTARERVVERFDSVMADVRTDLLIFSGTTTTAFLLALLIGFRRNPVVQKYLLPVSLALTGATLFAVYYYVFGQNWALALLTNDFMGWSYLTLLGFMFVFLLDIGFNKARVTRSVMNVLSGALG